MARLIDADKLEKEIIWTRMPSSVFQLNAVNLATVSSQDDVKAIPIEWIKRWISERNDFPTMPYNQHILNMIEEWEKENE